MYVPADLIPRAWTKLAKVAEAARLPPVPNGDSVSLDCAPAGYSDEAWRMLIAVTVNAVVSEEKAAATNTSLTNKLITIDAAASAPQLKVPTKEATRGPGKSSQVIFMSAEQGSGSGSSPDSLADGMSKVGETQRHSAQLSTSAFQL
ncbi:hypothetical protein H9P43_009572 [Blastocladiella emersonii ATCC 22665]|nr:hypothetical protein H9P43_009572 [Blastocladiella emersonii ATCC 22665]